MDDYWIDESIPVGPYQDNGFIEVFQSVLDDFRLNLQPFIILGRQYGKMFAAIDPADLRGEAFYYSTPDEITSERQKELAAFAKADTLLAVPRGTTEKLAKQFGEISEQRQKREIGKGNISGHGPRARTTFGHNGKKQY